MKLEYVLAEDCSCDTSPVTRPRMKVNVAISSRNKTFVSRLKNKDFKLNIRCL